jgi:hypothetical protein
MLKLFAIVIIAGPGCARITYERGAGGATMMVGTNLVTSSNATIRISGWSFMKDYVWRGSNAVLGAGSLASDTDAAAVEGAVRGAAEGVMKGIVPKP